MNMPFIPLQKQPWQPNPFAWILLIISILLFVAMFIGVARAEEPDWDKLVPIIIQIESGGNPNAISQDGCIGLMQISPIVLKEYIEIIMPLAFETKDLYYVRNIINLNEGSLYEPQFNVKIGTWYLKRIWNHYLLHYGISQTIENLLIAYNWGIGNLKKYMDNPNMALPKETRNYIKKYYALTGKHN